jgi:hypothetical protein
VSEHSHTHPTETGIFDQIEAERERIRLALQSDPHNELLHRQRLYMRYLAMGAEFVRSGGDELSRAADAVHDR